MPTTEFKFIKIAIRGQIRLLSRDFPPGVAMFQPEEGTNRSMVVVADIATTTTTTTTTYYRHPEFAS